jgi:acetyltransferase-like isoleucine patch superfamily enzyme
MIEKIQRFYYKKIYPRIYRRPVLTNKILKGHYVEVGKHTYGLPEIFFPLSGKKLLIGSFCSIGQNVIIFLGGNHRTDWVSTYPFRRFNNVFSQASNITGETSSKGNVVIGNDVWIGYGVTILSGVTIGDGAVIAAFSLVSKNVPPYTVVGGNPAKIIRQRFEQDIINQLLKIEWWKWEDKKINDNTSLLCDNKINTFIEKHKIN